MKRKIISRGFLGFPLGISVSYLITILSSLIYAQGYYSPCMPELVSAMGNEINAVALQALLSGLMGFGCAAGSVIWNIENWGVVKQTGIYFVVISAVSLPVAYAMYWMEHSIIGFLHYFGAFALIFAVIWAVSFCIGRYNVKKMNEGLRRTKDR